MTDSHCHLGSHKFTAEEIPEIIAHAEENGVHRMITLATDEDDLMINLKLAQDHERIFACLGIHPCDVHCTRDDFESLIRPHLTETKLAAIGETGLDYFHAAPEGWTEEDFRARQRDFLERHFVLAREAGLNVVIHTRDKSGTESFDDALEIYQDFHREVTAVFHCFPGPPDLAERVFALGGLISFTGIATFKNAQAVVDTVAACPADRFMLETDAPYLAPMPHRGKKCVPGFTRHTAEKIAEIRRQSLDKIVAQTEKTVTRFFRL